MLFANALKALREIAYPPSLDASAWYRSATDGVTWLQQNAKSDYVVLYANLGQAYVCSVLAPNAVLATPDTNALITAQVDTDRAWMIQHSWGGGGRKIYMQGPVSGAGMDALADGEQLVFRRHFEGYKAHRTVVELSQRLVQALNLHFLPERAAYCRLDARGDLEDVIGVWDKDDTDGRGSECVVAIMIEPLTEYMAITGQSLFRKFDFTRYVPGAYDNWGEALPKRQGDEDLFYVGKVGAGDCSYVSGGEILRTALTVEEMIAREDAKHDEANQRYETFKIVDRKNGGAHVEVSCGPESVVNYFTESDKPWEVSPAFFRPEVLARFKADPEKYELSERSITCRNAWHLKTYDINEAGQVHTYIVYLRHLPYEEQHYWKLYNEWPKAGLSKRAVENDLLGQVASDHDPLNSIKRTVAKLDQIKPGWWKPRGAELAARVLPPAVGSAKEWADEILALEQLTVEGFIKTPLKAAAEARGIKIDPAWASLRLIEALMETQGVSADDVKAVVAPLRSLNHMRNKVKGHASPEGKVLERQTLLEHGTFRAHFQALCSQIDGSMSVIVSVLATLSEPA